MMIPTPRRPEIDHRTLKLIVGTVALTLAFLTSAFAMAPLTSISESYWEGGPSQAIFIGFLFAIASFMLAFNGRSKTEMVMSKIAAMAALGVAMFPCICDCHPSRTGNLHYISASVMFLVLVFFCYAFYTRAKAKAHAEARVRAGVYVICGLAILLAMAVMAIDGMTRGRLGAGFPTLTFWCETTGLVAFGISWLFASHVLPAVNREDERFSPLRATNPDDSQTNLPLSDTPV